MALRRGSAAVLAVCAAAAAVSVAAVVVRLSSPTSGAVIRGDGFGSEAVVIDVLPGAETALGAGDVVTGIAGRPILTWAEGLLDPDRQALAVAIDGRVRFDVLRGGEPVAIDVAARPYPLAQVLFASWGTLGFVLILLGVAAYVFWRRPAVPAAGALLVGAVGGAGSTLPFLLGTDPLDLATGDFNLTWFVTAAVYLLLWAGLIDFLLVFPRPFGALVRHPLRRLVAYAAIFGSYITALALAAMASPTTLAWIGDSGRLTLLPVALMFATAPVVLAVRWRRGPLEDRRLLRAFAYVIGFILVVDLVVWVGPEALGGRPLLPWTVAGLTGLPFPVVIAASILRHRAFDIDVVVRRSLVYGGLTVGVVAIYAIAAALFGAVLGTAGLFATPLLATGVAAIAALPIRDGLQRATSRLLFGDRDEPVRAMRRLGRQLEWSAEAETMPRTVVDTVADALRLPYVALELGVGHDARLGAERGEPTGSLIERPLAFNSRPVGRLLVAPRGETEPLSASDLRLLDDLTRQVGVAVHAALLTDDLLASRERIVTAREEERRRLRRDLHDGLGPALAAIGMRAEAAESLLRTEPASAERLLTELRSEISGALTDVRRLIDGLRPPALDDLGLIGAIRAAGDRLTADGPPDVAVESAGSLSDLPAAAEVAAYRIAVEGMTNAVRHASADHCWVRLLRESDLTIIVDDDGRGIGAEPREGVGLLSMQERSAELGGECVVGPRPDGGTRVVARLPLESRESPVEP